MLWTRKTKPYRLPLQQDPPLRKCLAFSLVSHWLGSAPPEELESYMDMTAHNPLFTQAGIEDEAPPPRPPVSTLGYLCLY